MTIPRIQNDSLIVDVTVKENDVVKDISGGTVDAAVAPINADGTLGAKTNVTATITDASNGVARFTCPLDTLDTVQNWLAELRLALGSERQTVWQEPIVVSQAVLAN